MVFAADAHLAVGQLLYQKTIVIKGNSLKFREGTRMPTVSSKKIQNLKPL
jgi:hypothetical protein